MNHASRFKRSISATTLAFALTFGVSVLVAPSAAAAGPVTVVRFEGNPCFVPAQKLSRWKVVVDGAGYFLEGGPGRSITFNPRPGSHNYNVQSWCNGIFKGRTSSGNRWTYSTGTSNAVFIAGIHTG